MRRIGYWLPMFLLVALTSTTLGDEVVLKDGSAHDVDILETGSDYIVAGFESGETKGQVKVSARELEPHSFYEIRSRHMEKTAENHLLLAKFCAENGMFTRAKAQADKARAIDAAYVERELSMPGVMEGLAATVLKQARDLLAKGDLQEAERYATAVLDRLPDTQAGEEAAALLDEIESRTTQQQEEAMSEAVEAAKQKDEAEATAALDAFENQVKPLVRKYEAARKLNNEALKEKNSSKAVRALEASAKTFEALHSEAEKLLKQNDEPLVVQRIETARDQLRTDAVEAYVHAGERLLARGTYAKALDYANEALRIDPSSPYANSLKTRTELAQAAASRWRK